MKKSLQKLKAFEIKRIREMEKRQKVFFNEILKKSGPKRDFLTIKQLCEKYSLSRKTFDRLREKGLPVIQSIRNGKYWLIIMCLRNFSKKIVLITCFSK